MGRRAGGINGAAGVLPIVRPYVDAYAVPLYEEPKGCVLPRSSCDVARHYAAVVFGSQGSATGH
jgi:hypothetical protein